MADVVELRAQLVEQERIARAALVPGNPQFSFFDAERHAAANRRADELRTLIAAEEQD